MSAPPPPDALAKPNNPFGTGTTWEDALDYWPTRVKNPKALAAAIDLTHAMIAHRDGGPPAPLHTVRAALNAPAAEVRTTAADALPTVLAAQPRPFDTLIDLWTSVRAPGRAQMASRAGLCRSTLSEPQELDFRSRGLRDRSKLVRRHAAGAAGDHLFTPILPLLNHVASHDPDEPVRHEARVAADLIEHGYHLHNQSNNTDCITLTLLTRGHGWRARVITAIPRSDADRIGLHAAIARLQHELDEETRDFDRWCAETTKDP